MSCLVYLAVAEQCTVDTDCVSTLCSAGSKVICQHPDGAGIVTKGGLCTCAQGTGECIRASDCYGNLALALRCPDEQRHCYDNKCICDRFIGLKVLKLIYVK
ncbi:hypothetical protein DPMN_069565 [Dreissena polymorpha]|uniref:Uncharacterized protein n=1 Tax=Dreissena polymorpha TaxID=45954 RepID=A0A9D3Z4K5_DREPO|nr:hypothetical protein DPMN_069565 [Dreissena polymorpha]